MKTKKEETNNKRKHKEQINISNTKQRTPQHNQSMWRQLS